jgi:formylglycine-generating enzyme
VKQTQLMEKCGHVCPPWITVVAVGFLCGCATVSRKEAPQGLAVVPAGPFRMGNDDTNYTSRSAAESPVHRVRVGAFLIDRREITQAQWNEVRAWGLTNGFSDLPAGESGYSAASSTTAGHPVTQVNWYDVVKWCNARSEKEGLPPLYYTSRAQSSVYRTGELNLSNEWVRWSARGYRLPTEAEWEKAARGGLEGQFYPWPSQGGRCTNHMDASKANYKGSRGNAETTPVGYYDGHQEPEGPDMANGYGLYDMAGNVWEWCWDYCGETYYAESSAADPHGPATAPYGIRIKRGGSWRDSEGEDLRCARRNLYDPGTSNPYTGFRCVRRP